VQAAIDESVTELATTERRTEELAAALSGALAEQAGVRTIHVSLTHEGAMAAAVVVVER